MRFLIILFLFSPGVYTVDNEKPELICVKNNKSRNTCYYNFRIDGKKYHFMDVGCKYSKTKVFDRIEEGTIALGKGWKVQC